MYEESLELLVSWLMLEGFREMFFFLNLDLVAHGSKLAASYKLGYDT